MAERSNLSQAGSTYFWCCSLLETVLSAFHYLEVHHFDSKDIAKLFSTWSASYYVLLEYLQDEIHFPLENENISPEKRRHFYQKSEAIGDKIIFDSVSSLLLAWEAYSQNNPKPESLYFGYCHWLSTILTKFGTILENFQNSIYYERYNNNSVKLMQLKKAINGGVTSLNLDLSDVLKTRLIGCVEKLYSKWEKTVLNAIENS